MTSDILIPVMSDIPLAYSIPVSGIPTNNKLSIFL